MAENPIGPAVIGGNCPGNGTNVVTGAVAGKNVSLLLNEGGNLFSVTATIGSNGISMAEAYQGTSTGCTDSGTFTATQVSPLNGPYSGNLQFPDGSYDSVYATLVETGDHTLTANVQVAGTDKGSFVMSGMDIGDGLYLTGSFSGNSLNYYGYYDRLSLALLIYDASSGIYLGSLTAASVL